MITKINFMVFCTVLIPVLSGGECIARSSFGDGTPGLDVSYSSSYSGQRVSQEFDRDLGAFNRAADQVPEAGEGIQDEGAVVPDLPGFKFHSGFSHSTVYESNLFHTRLDPVDDLITLPTAWAGVSLGREGTSEYFFENTYGITYMDYVENDKFDQLAHVNHTQLDWKREKLLLSVSNEFSPLSPVGVANRSELRTAGAVNSATVTSNRFSFKSAYQLRPKLALSHIWSHRIEDFPADAGSNTPEIELQSQQVHSFQPGLTYTLTPKTTLFIFYRFETSDYFRGGVFAFKSHEGRAGFNTRFTPKLSGLFQAGMKSRDLNQPVFQDGMLFGYQAALRYAWTPKLTLSAYWSGSTGEVPDTSDPADALPNDQGSGVDENNLGVRLDWAVSPKMSVGLNGSVRLDSREGQVTLPDQDNPTVSFTRQREDLTYRWGVHWQWTRSAFDRYYLGYDFSNKNSSFKDFESEDHRMVAAVVLDLNARGGGYGR
jgi:hypothetical protein